MARRFPLAAAMGILAVGAGLAAFFLLTRVFQKTPEVRVPPVVGLGLSEALDHLGAAKLDLEVGGFEYSDQIPENLVLRQRPDAGRVVKAKRSVRVVLSRGPERHQVPEVGGLTVDDARIQLGEAGFRADVTARVHGGREGEVVAQGVQAGAWLLKGRSVPLVVSAGRAPLLVRMPALEGLPAEKAASELDSSLLKQGPVQQLPVEDPAKIGVVLRQAPPSGYPVAGGSLVAFTVGAGATGPHETAGSETPAPEDTQRTRPAATPRTEGTRGRAEGGERP